MGHGNQGDIVMKIRDGFVSNSSSSSFVLKWKKEDFKRCECCKHLPIDPLSLVESEVNESDGWDETKVDWVGTEEWRVAIKDDMDFPLKELVRLRRMSMNDLAYDASEYGGGTTTVGEAIRHNEDHTDECQKEIEETRRIDKEESDLVVCCVSVTYGSFISPIIEDLIENGTIQLISKGM